MKLGDTGDQITPPLLNAMSEGHLKAFMEAFKTDPVLKEKLHDAAGAQVVVAIAKAAGFMIFSEELRKAQAELSDEELEGVVGVDRERKYVERKLSQVC